MPTSFAQELFTWTKHISAANISQWMLPIKCERWKMGQNEFYGRRDAWALSLSFALSANTIVVTKRINNTKFRLFICEKCAKRFLNFQTKADCVSRVFFLCLLLLVANICTYSRLESKKRLLFRINSLRYFIFLLFSSLFTIRGIDKKQIFGANYSLIFRVCMPMDCFSLNPLRL